MGRTPHTRNERLIARTLSGSSLRNRVAAETGKSPSVALSEVLEKETCAAEAITTSTSDSSTSASFTTSIVSSGESSARKPARSAGDETFKRTRVTSSPPLLRGWFPGVRRAGFPRRRLCQQYRRRVWKRDRRDRQPVGC